jgi:hypothetical protein
MFWRSLSVGSLLALCLGSGPWAQSDETGLRQGSGRTVPGVFVKMKRKPVYPRADVSTDLARMYPFASEWTYQAVRKLVRDLGIAVRRDVQEHQILVSEQQHSSRRRFPELFEAAASAVSGPKAHVYVNAFIGGPTQWWAHRGEAERWLLDRLDERLGTAGEAIPLNDRRHRRKALALLDRARVQLVEPLRARIPVADVGETPAFSPPDSRVTPPTRIEVSYVAPLLPADRRDELSKRSVVVSAIVQESGYVVPALLNWSQSDSDRVDDPGLAASTLQAVGFWRAEPATFEGRPTDSWFMVFVNFSSRWRSDWP